MTVRGIAGIRQQPALPWIGQQRQQQRERTRRAGSDNDPPRINSETEPIAIKPGNRLSQFRKAFGVTVSGQI